MWTELVVPHKVACSIAQDLHQYLCYQALHSSLSNDHPKRMFQIHDWTQAEI